MLSLISLLEASLRIGSRSTELKLVHEIGIEHASTVRREIGTDANQHIGLCEVHGLAAIGSHQFGEVHLNECERRGDALEFGHLV